MGGVAPWTISKLQGC